MSRRNYTLNWIEAYLEWNGADSWAMGSCQHVRRGISETRVDASEEFVAAYLDWMDVGRGPGTPHPDYQPTAFARDLDGIVDPMSGLDLFGEALLFVLHNQSDRIQYLRAILDAGDATPRTLKLASEALEHEARLLEDERRALPLLSCLDQLQSPTARRSNFENNCPRVLDAVATELRALKETVLAMQSVSPAFPHNSRVR